MVPVRRDVCAEMARRQLRCKLASWALTRSYCQVLTLVTLLWKTSLFVLNYHGQGNCAKDTQEGGPCALWKRKSLPHNQPRASNQIQWATAEQQKSTGPPTASRKYFRMEHHSPEANHYNLKFLPVLHNKAEPVKLGIAYERSWPLILLLLSIKELRKQWSFPVPIWKATVGMEGPQHAYVEKLCPIHYLPSVSSHPPSGNEESSSNYTVALKFYTYILSRLQILELQMDATKTEILV